ncbi:hypothetical protein [Dongia sp.]|uniref:hypothetical protein n=1 Tax=Dongia sp. TaxID=1977262 RepID=UPI0035AD882F
MKKSAREGGTSPLNPKKLLKIMNLTKTLAIAGLILTALAGSAQATPPRVAVVEDSQKTAGLGQIFDMLAENDVIELAPTETITLGYTKSCVREHITGGRVVVGRKESTVTGGSVNRETVQCAVNKLALNADESAQSATIAFRGAVKHIYVRQPVVMAGKSEGVVVEAMDGDQTWKVVPKNGRIDFADEKIELTPGASYRLKGFTQTVIVEVDPKATSAKTGKLERLVILD